MERWISPFSVWFPGSLSSIYLAGGSSLFAGALALELGFEGFISLQGFCNVLKLLLLGGFRPSLVSFIALWRIQALFVSSIALWILDRVLF